MSAPTTQTNLDKISACVAYCLGQITQANGFYTDGIVVDRGKDPTNFSEDKLSEFRERMVLIGIGTGTRTADPSRTGGVRRYFYTFPLLCFRRGSKDDLDADGGRKTLDRLLFEVLEDIDNSIEDRQIKAAAATLGFPVINLANDRISCIDSHVVEMRSDGGLSWPDIHFDCIVQLRYDRSLR
jgi:hypothetical protein